MKYNYISDFLLQSVFINLTFITLYLHPFSVGFLSFAVSKPMWYERMWFQMHFMVYKIRIHFWYLALVFIFFKIEFYFVFPYFRILNFIVTLFYTELVLTANSNFIYFTSIYFSRLFLFGVSRYAPSKLINLKIPYINITLGVSYFVYSMNSFC